MRNTVLVDAGAIVALPNRRDQHHAAIAEAWDTRIVSIDDGLELMRGWMAKYADLPCDFADASLLFAAWRTGRG